WLFHSSKTCVVTFTGIEYASRPNQAIDGRGLSPHKTRSLVGCSTATHFRDPPYAIAGWIETSCLVPGRYELHATMRGAQGEVDTAVLPVTVKPVQHPGRTPCRVT